MDECRVLVVMMLLLMLMMVVWCFRLTVEDGFAVWVLWKRQKTRWHVAGMNGVLWMLGIVIGDAEW